MKQITPFIDRQNRVDTLSRLAASNSSSQDAMKSHKTEELLDLYEGGIITGCKEKESEKEIEQPPEGGRRGESLRSLCSRPADGRSMSPGPVTDDATLIF